MSRTHRQVAVEPELPITPAGLLVAEIAARPAIARQLGTAAYQQLLAVIVSPDTATVNSIWVESLFQPVLRMLLSELPEHRDQILDAAASVQRSIYEGPRSTDRYVRCPWCGDVAEITGQSTADCMSCGTVSPRRQR